MPGQTPSRPIGAHVPVTGGLAAGGLRYAAETGALLRHPATRGVPFVVETPGPRAVVAADMATLRALRGKGQAVRTPAGAMR